MHQNTPSYNSNIHFEPLWPVGGALEGENLQEGVGGGFSEARALVLFLNVLNWSIKEVLGGGLMIFRFHLFIYNPYSNTYSKY